MVERADEALINLLSDIKDNYNYNLKSIIRE